VIQEKYLSELSLHYKWSVHFGNGSGFYLSAEDAERWDMNLIYQDTVQMALVLQKNTQEIRELKKATFKRNKDMKVPAESLVQEGDYAGLIKWMISKVDKKISLVK
jgi:hypothetical protein